MSGYKCVGCEQEIETIYSRLAPTTPPPRPIVLTAKLCKPCTHRMGNSVGFRKAVESRAMKYAIRDYLPDLVSLLGEPIERLQQRCVENCKARAIEPDMCAFLDMLFQLPHGTCFNVESGATK